MPTPSDAYSDIGAFQPGEDGWWFGKTGDHPGLKQRLTELGIDVIHRDTDANKSNYTPEDGAALYAEDSQVLYLGDGSGWNAQSSWGKSPSFDSVSTASLSGSYIQRIRAFSETGHVASIDPSSSSSPLQDAIDAINADSGAGRIILPPGQIHEQGPLTGWGGKQILGYGNAYGGTELILDGDNPLVLCDTSVNNYTYWDGILFKGGGKNQPCFDFQSGVAGCNFGRLVFANFANGSEGVISFNGATAWASNWDYIRFTSDCTGRCVSTLDGSAATGTPQLRIGMLETYATGGEPVVKNVDGPDMHIGTLNVGGAHSQAVYVDQNIDRKLTVDYINFETTSGTQTDIVEVHNEGQTRLGYVKLRSGITVDSMVLGEFEHGNTIVGTLATKGTINNNKIVVNSAPNAPNFYFGPASDITNSTGTQTWQALASAGTSV